MQKTASPTTVTPGGLVTYTYIVTNPGEAALSDVTLTDDKCGPSTVSPAPVATPTANGLLDPKTETWKYSCSANLLADTTNTATARGTPPVGDG